MITFLKYKVSSKPSSLKSKLWSDIMKTKNIATGAIVASMYVVLTYVSASVGLASGAIQLRLSEALTVLPYFMPSSVWGLTIGCFISNLLTGCVLWDVIFGTLATFLGALMTYSLRRLSFKHREWLTPAGPILSNTIIIPIVLSKVYNMPYALWYLALTVGIGEVISCGVFGMILLFSLKKHISF